MQWKTTRIRLVVAAVCSAALFTHSFALAGGVEPTRISLPSGPASVEGLGRNFVPSLASGTASFGVDIAVPPAAGGFAPKLALDYDGGGGASELGMGWRISGLPSIRRRVEDGLPRFEADDAFELAGIGLPCDLLAMPDGFFRPEHEGGAFVRVGRSGDGSMWEAREKSGTTFRFGGADHTEEEAGRVATYLLREQADLHGHVIRYTWDTSSGYALLTSVTWNDFSKKTRQQIVLSYEDRQDVHELFSSGIRRLLSKRLAAVEVTVGGALARRYLLRYAAGPHSLLSTVEMVGTDGVTALPTLILDYTEASFAVDGQVTTMKRPPGFAPGPNAALSDMNGDGLPDLLVTQAGQYRSYVNHDGSAWGSAQAWTPSDTPSVALASSGVQLADLDGDGASDLVVKSGADVFRYFPGKDATHFAPSVAIKTVPSFTFEDPNVRLADLDGDRRTDVIVTTPAGIAVGYNRGGEDWTAPTAVGKVDPRQELLFADGKTQLCDVNGDRVQDFCYLRAGSLNYWLGRGRGAFEKAQKASGVPAFDGSDPWKLTDLNGDGWVDLVHVGVNQVDYALAVGAGQFSLPRAVAQTPAKGPNTRVEFADINGSGTTDIVWIDVSGSAEPAWRYLELFPEGRGGLLKQIANGLGKVTRIFYKPAASDAAAAREAGADWATRMNVAMPVVDRIEVDDSLGDPTLVTRYTYGNGSWDPKERTFAGFGAGVLTEVGDEYTPTLVTESTFDTGVTTRMLRGVVLTSETRQESGAVFTRTKNDYARAVLGTSRDARPIQYAFRASTRVEHIEGAEEQHARLTLSEWVQDDYGNVIEERQWGEVSNDDPLVGDDERITVRTFANNTSDWILGRVATEEVRDADGQRVAMKRSYYDGNPFQGLALGRLTRGDLTRTDSWIDGERFADVGRYQYDDQGNAIVGIDARGGRQELDYDSETHTFIRAERRYSSDSNFLEWTTEYDPRTGVLTEVTLPTGASSSFRYDALGRLIAIVRPGDSLDLPTASYEYGLESPLSRVTTRQRATSGSAQVLTSHSVVDGLGRPRGTFKPAEDGHWALSGLTTLDARGNTAFAAVPSFEKDLVLPKRGGRDGKWTYRDATGRTIATRHNDNSSTRAGYGPFTRTVWDENDNDPDSLHFDTPTSYMSDGFGRLRAVVDREGEKAFRTSYSYDSLGNLLTIEDAAGSVRSYAFDGRSRRTAIDDPNAGHWDFEFTDGNDLERRIDPAGNVIRYAYDALGRVTEEWHHKGTQESEQRVSAYHYDAPADAHGKLEANLAGSLAWVEDAAGKLFLSYDARGHQVRALRQWTDGTEHVTRSAFDAADRQVERGYPDDTFLSFEFNARSLLQAVGPVASNIQWRASGQLDSVTLGNGVVDRREYDDRQRLRRLAAVAPNGQVLRDVGYTVDAASRITGIDDLRPRVTKYESASASYAFDDRSRLREATDPLGKTTFDYDDVGKIRKIESERADPSLNVTNTYGEDGAGPDVLTRHGDEVLKYDAAGRLVEDGTRRLSWDAKGRLARVERAGTVEEYTYAFDDSRAMKVTTQESGRSEVRYIAPDVEDRDGKLVRYVSIHGERIARLDSPDTAGAQSTSSLGSIAPHDYGMARILALLVAAVAAAFAIFRSLSQLRRGRLSLAFGTLLLFVFAVGCSAGKKEPLNGSGTEIRELPTDTIFYLADIQGSPLAIADLQGASISSSTYFPYGLIKNAEGPRVDPHRFVGNEYDEGADLADFHARPYRADLGVFLAPDPLALFSPEKLLEDPRRLYAYVYAGADPINGSDPTGLTFGEYLSGIWDQAKEDVVATAHAVIDTQMAQIDALANGRVGDYVTMQVNTAKALVSAPVELVKNVANFGDNFAEAVFADNDYEMGRKAVKPITTAVSATASVLGIAQTAKGALSRGCPCFAPDTLVQTAGGLRPIGEVQVGDLVLARDPDTGAEAYKPVVRVFVTPDKPLVELRLSNDMVGEETIRATPGHPFWVKGRGWTTAGEIDLGDEISTAQAAGLYAIAASSAPEAGTVYNLEVADFHTYFVGKGEAWVHNVCSCGSPKITPGELTGKTRSEIRNLANQKGLKPAGDAAHADYPRKWKDPATNKERLRLDRGHTEANGTPYDDPRAAADHVHGYDETGGKLKDPNGNNPHFPTTGE